MNKKFSDNEVRAYSKNRFEERALRARLERLREQLTEYQDATARTRSHLVQESRTLRRTSGATSPRPSALGEGGGASDGEEEEFPVSGRVRRPWAYSVMETTYNSVYREAEIQAPRRRDRRARSKSAVTIRLYSSSSGKHGARSDIVAHKHGMSTLVRNAQSAKHASNVSFLSEAKQSMTESQITGYQSQHTEPANTDEELPVFAELDEDHNTVEVHDKNHEEPVTAAKNGNVENTYEEQVQAFSNSTQDNRPYAKVLYLPPAYKIDSRAYQDAERQRLAQRSRSRVSFTSPSGVTFVPSESNQKKDKAVAKTDDKVEKTTTTAESDKNNESVNKQEEKENVNTDNHAQRNENNTEMSQNVVKAAENVMFRGHVIKNYIRPEDRYKLDPSILNRRQNRMDKLAKESSTYLKRINHENIKVEIAFPRSARKRLLTKLVQENNSGKKKSITNMDAPFIQTKVNRFMVSIDDYITRQQRERAKSFIY